jgi:hypothetical protein
MNPKNLMFWAPAVLLLSACASNTPPAAPAIAAGAVSLDTARSAGAAELSAVDLNNARMKLDRARVLAQAGNNQEALRLAEAADVDAQLARAKAASERSRKAVAELDASLQTLRDEMGRMQQNPAAAATAQPRVLLAPVPTP